MPNHFKKSKYDNNFRIAEIKDFINWLVEWESDDFDSNGKLTPETFHSLILSFRSLLSFTDILFNDPSKLGLNFEPGYLLTGKLQTDILEKRFGTYRQLNGIAYAMKLKELVSGEKKN